MSAKPNAALRFDSVMSLHVQGSAPRRLPVHANIGTELVKSAQTDVWPFQTMLHRVSAVVLGIRVPHFNYRALWKTKFSSAGFANRPATSWSARPAHVQTDTLVLMGYVTKEQKR
eukprot:3558227-Amphidinium_carterae.1